MPEKGCPEFKEKIHDHFNEDERRFNEIMTILDTMKNNHLYHIEKSVQAIESGMSGLHEKVDENTRETIENSAGIKWIMRIGGGAWAVALIFITAMVYVLREAILK